jgi:hypothetical protein
MIMRRDVTMNTVAWCYSIFDVLDFICCDIGKEGNSIPGTERILFCFKINKKQIFRTALSLLLRLLLWQILRNPYNLVMGYETCVAVLSSQFCSISVFFSFYDS